MQLEVKKLPKSETILIPVADELIDSATDIETIKCEGKIYRVYDFFVYQKGRQKPLALLYLALGSLANLDKIFEVYNKSEFIYLFVCNYEKEIEIEKNKSSKVEAPSLFG